MAGRKGDTTPQVIYEESPNAAYQSGNAFSTRSQNDGQPTTKRVYKNIQPALDEESGEGGSVFSSHQQLQSGALPKNF